MAEQSYNPAEPQGRRGKQAPARGSGGIRLYANIGSAEEARLALGQGAEGIGLLRSEFLYLGRAEEPEEETQLEAYKAVALMLKGRKLMIRTLDIGADRQVSYMDLPKEKNPALGFRGIRLGLAHPQLLKTQLRALYRASAFGDVSIVFPMVSHLEELRQAKQLAQEVCCELQGEGIPFRRDVPLGVMIETPAGALISDALAAESDFFTIGANDLAQYTLATDRKNHRVQCDFRHEAVLRLIELVAANAAARGIPCGICGELAADSDMLPRFIQMGMDHLSVEPARMMALRRHLK